MTESDIRADRVGQRVGDYSLLRLLGGGGFGEVYLAEHVRDHSFVAVKILHARLSNNEELKLFINEARTFRLKHPHIVPLLDFGITLDEVPYLVMEYASMGTLRERHPLGKPVPLFSVVSYVNQVASALQYAHNLYLIHRDVKPENMLIGANGEILLTDFGIATVAHNSLTLSRQQAGVGGTASYMAPEQIEGKPQPASDQYALAVLTYEWLTGQRPFQGTAMEVMMQHMVARPASLSQHSPLLSAKLEHVVFTALAKDPRQRFSNVQAFASALAQASQLQQPAPFSPQFRATTPPLFHQTGTMPETSLPVSGISLSNQQASPPLKPPPPAGPLPPAPKRPSWRKISLLLSLVLLILGVSTFAYFTLGGSHPGAHTGAVSSTPTSRLAVTPTPVVTPTPPDLHTDPMGFYTWLTSKPPTGTQSFSDGASDWDTTNGCLDINGDYQASAQPAAGVVILASCMAQRTNYVDFAFQVDMTMTKGETAGLIFRSNAVLNAEYLLEINSDNTYYLNTSTPSFATQNTVLPRASFSKEARAGNAGNAGQRATNRFTVIASGHDIYLFINGHYLTKADDATSSSGQIGTFVEASPNDTSGALANFSNLKVWTLS